MDTTKHVTTAIDEARDYLVELLPHEYKGYIETELAGDFAVVLAKKLRDASQALSFYKSAACYFAEGVEFMSKEQIFDALKEEFNAMNEQNETMIKCPVCGHIFPCSETFEWVTDNNGDPCEEHLYCPKCGVSTQQRFDCSICPGKALCKREKECLACLSVKYDEFVSAD